MPLFRHILILFFILGVCIQAQAAGGGGGNTIASPYLALKPPFVLNVANGEEVHHLELAISFVPLDATVNSLIAEHEAAIRHAIVILISGRQTSELNTTQQKIKLREEITREVNKVLLENTKKEEAIKRTLITGFLIQ